MEYDVSGIVTKASNDSCDVSFSIDGTATVLSFGPSVFYSFGVRCEGNMANILEEGTEVELCYRSSHAGYPCIVAVWLGEKPDCFSDSDYTDVSSEDNLAAVYDKVGRVVSVNKDTFIVKSDSCQVVVSKDVAFRDGRRFDVETTLEINEEVTYDAIPCEDPSGVTHRATCAWVGVPPGLVQRFRLDATDDELVKVMTKHIYGVVLVIPSEVLALVEVEFESSLFKVMLFRSSFKPACKRIQDKVAVGDTLCMRLTSRCIFGGSMQLFAARVMEDESTFEFEESVKADNSLKDVTSVGNVGSCLENVSNCVEDLFNVDDKLVVLYSSPPLRGVISKYSYDSACISYGLLKIFIDRDNFYMDGRKASVAEFMLFVAPGNNVVHFEAVPTTMRGFSHEATCVWVGEKPGLKAVLSSLPSPNFDLLEEKGKFFYGVVSKLCLPELAFVEIPSESTTACIHVSECASKSWYTSLENFCDKIGLISSYLGLKDCVQFKVERLENILFAREVSVVRSLDRVFSEAGTFRPPVPRRKKANEVIASIVVKARKAGLKKSAPKKGATKNISYSRVAAMTVTKLAAGEIPTATGEKASAVRGVSGKNAPTQKARGKNAISQNNVGRKETVPCGKTTSGKKAAGKNKIKNAASHKAPGKNAATQNVAGKKAASHNASGKKAATQNAAGKNAASQKASGKNAASQKASGKNAASQKASGKNAASQKASGKNAASQKASGKNAASQKASGKNAASQKASGKNAASQKSSGKNAASQKASGKNAATQKASDKNAAAQKASSSGKNAATQKASDKNAVAQKASSSGKNAATQKAAGKNAAPQKANGKNSATQKAGGKTASKSVTAKIAVTQKAGGKNAARKSALGNKTSTQSNNVKTEYG